MGRHKNTDGTFVPVGLKIRFEIINRLYQTPGLSVKIPSARELAARFHLSPSTVTLELQKLVREGYLIGRRGSGTYTNPEKAYFMPGSISRKVVGILVADGKLLVYDAVDWAALSYCGMALSPEIARPRFVTLLTSSPENIYEELLSQNLSGLIWIHPKRMFYGIIHRLLQNNFPVIAVKSDDPEIPSINYSFYQSGMEIAKTVIREKRHLLFSVPTNNDFWTLQRVAGINDYIAGHPEAKLEHQVFSLVQNCTEQLEECLRAGRIPDAVFCSGEYVYVMMDLAKKYGIDIRQRCRLFAEAQHIMKNEKFHGYTIEYSFPEIGEKVAEMMEILLKNPAERFPIYEQPAKLVFQEGKSPQE